MVTHESALGDVAPLNIYLAGKIEKNCWRHTLVPSLRNHGPDYSDDSESMGPWGVVYNAIFGRHHYVGPFFVGCDHGCFHGPDQHGVGASGRDSGDPGEGGVVDDVLVWGCSGGTLGKGFRRGVQDRCLRAIDKANVVFAWITTLDCYGTLAELGYAKAQGVRILIGVKDGLDVNDLWFILSMADDIVRDETALKALLRLLPTK